MSKFKLSTKDMEIVELMYIKHITKHSHLSLFRSAEIGNDILTELLLERGADVTVDEEGHDPLYVAVQYMIFEGLVFNENYEAVFTSLIRHGADVEALKDLYEEELSEYEAAVLNDVIGFAEKAFVKKIKVAPESDEITDTVEVPEETTDGEEKESDHSGDSNTVAGSDKSPSDSDIITDEQQNTSYSKQDSGIIYHFLKQAPQEFIITLSDGIDEDTFMNEKRSNAERREYEKSIAAIKKYYENPEARAENPKYSDNSNVNKNDSYYELFATSLYPEISEGHSEFETPFSNIADPLFVAEVLPFFSINSVMLTGLVMHSYPNFVSEEHFL